MAANAAARSRADHLDDLRRELRLLSQAVTREAHVIRQAPSLVHQQIRNRLYGQDKVRLFRPDARQRLDEGSAGRPKRWLKRCDQPGDDDRQSARLIAVLEGHKQTITAVAFSADGQRIASADLDGFVRVWEVGPPVIEVFATRARTIPSAVSFSPNGTIVACGFRNGDVELRDATTGEVRRQWKVGDYYPEIPSLAFSPDGTLLAVGGQEAATVWDVRSGELRHSFRDEYATGLDWRVGSVHFMDGGRILAFNRSCNFEFWSLETNERMVYPHSGEFGFSQIPLPEREIFFAKSFAISRDATLIVAARDSFSAAIAIWDLRSGRARIVNVPHVDCVSLSADGHLIAAVGGRGGSVAVLDQQKGSFVSAMIGHDAPPHVIAFASRGRLLVSGAENGSLLLWDLADYATESSAAPQRPLVVGQMVHHDRAISRDGALVVVAVPGRPGTGPLTIADAATGAHLAECEGHRELVMAVDLTADGRRIVSGSIDVSLRVWNTRTGKPLLTIEAAAANGVRAAAISSKVRFLASGDRRGTVTLWDGRTGEKIEAWPGHTDVVMVVKFSHDDRLLASASKGAVKVWDVKTRREMATMDWPHDEWPEALAFSQDGRWVACSGGRSVRLWEMDDLRKSPISLSGNSGYVAFSPDGQWLAFGGLPIRLFSLRSRAIEATVFTDRAVIEGGFHDERSTLLVLPLAASHVHEYAIVTRGEGLPANATPR